MLKFYPWAIPLIVTLGILASLSEGIGISLFIPFLQNAIATGEGTATQDYLTGFLGWLFDLVAKSDRQSLIAGAIFGCILLKNLLVYSNLALLGWLNARIAHRLRSQIFERLLRLSYSFIETNDSGKFLNTLASETWRVTEALEVLVNLTISVCTISVYTVLLLLISWQLTLIVSLIMLTISLVVKYVTRQSKTLGQKAVRVNGALGSRMYEGLAGMKTIRAFARESYEQKQFERASFKVSNVFLKLSLLSGAVNPLYEVLSALLVLSVMVIALLQNGTALPSLLTFLLILYRLQPQIQHLDGNRIKLSMLVGSIDDVMYFLEEDQPYILSGERFFDRLNREITLKTVGFRYSPQDTNALQDISFSIPQGKTIALVGSSGAGKSTLINLLCRFYEPTNGEIYVDGYPLKEFELDSWRGRISTVSQDIFLFSTTVKDNIAYGCLNATNTEIIEAAKLAHAHDFIMQLPHGYKTKIGDRGMRLSGGQRQRIALARAIVRNPEILILDEATNALDSISENSIQEAIDTLSKNRTLIAIAHRLSTIEKADCIIVLDKGKIVQQGTFNELLKQGGLFGKLYSLQHGDWVIGNR